MSTIAIITARGGSKRIPKKNIKNFYGKPMLAYAIEAALGAEIFDEVMVSTDSDEIAYIAKKYGANVPFMRSDLTASDTASTYDVIEEVIFEYKKRGVEYDEICCIYPCVPFLKPYTLKLAYDEFIENGYNAAQSVCVYPAPVEWAMKIQDGILVPNDPKMLMVHSQNLTPKYFDAGMFYYIRTDILLLEKTLVPTKTHGFVVDESECQDIDTIDDWKSAEIKYRVLEAKSEDIQ